MALNYNGTYPTAIKYNGTDLTVLKYGSTAVWGKPYSLSITTDSYTTVTVNRTSSPNQGASTGNLSSGSVVYYGDVLRITATANSGYNRTTFRVNGLDYGDSITITVTSAVTVEAYSSPAQSWKTVWTGSTNIAINSKPSIGITGGVVGRTTNLTISGLQANIPTRITFASIGYGSSTSSVTNFVTSSQTLQTACGAGYQMLVGLLGPFQGQNSDYLQNLITTTGACGIGVDTPTSANRLPIRDIASRMKASTTIWVTSCIITKIEQYY